MSTLRSKQKNALCGDHVRPSFCVTSYRRLNRSSNLHGVWCREFLTKRSRVSVSLVNVEQRVPLYLRCKRIRTLTFHISWPIWVKFGIRDAFEHLRILRKLVQWKQFWTQGRNKLNLAFFQRFCPILTEFGIGLHSSVITGLVKGALTGVKQFYPYLLFDLVEILY